MAENIDSCSVGKLTGTDCHLSSYTKKRFLHSIENLSKNDLSLLQFRVKDFHLISSDTICDHHKCQYLVYFTILKSKTCCDPFERHKKSIHKDLRVIKLDLSEAVLENLKLKLIPGGNICGNCENFLKEKLSLNQKEDSAKQATKRNDDNICNAPRRSDKILNQEKICSVVDNSQEDSQKSYISSGSSEFVSLSQGQKGLNTILTGLGLPNLESSQLFRTRRIQDANKLVQNVCINFAKQCSTTLGMDILIPEPVTQNILEDSLVLQRLIINIQREFEKSKIIQQKLKYLALLPKDWNRRKICQYLNCTRYLFYKLSKFREMDDYPNNIDTWERKKYVKISSELNLLMKNYYSNDENVYTCPGKKDYISVKDETGKKIFVQKKLLLYTVNDLYLKFKEEYKGNEKVPSFSHFFSLKPPECIHAGDPGSLNICICAQHENINLKLYALSRKLKSRDLIVGAVCNVDAENCMIGMCDKCPGEKGVSNLLEKIIDELDIELREGKIKYKNWKDKGSAAYLEDFEKDVEELKKEICTDIKNLTKHQFIADAQKRYLNYCKSIMTSDECIVLMDFSENYSFIIQNSVQSFYYNNTQATVHPFVVYYKSEETGELVNKNYCVISDCKDHFAYTVNAFTAKFLQSLKATFKWIKSIIYFSDGAPQQYKNKNNLANILKHEEDFGLKVTSYNFFATSHGKSSCDAIGGTVKRTVMRHCIRAPPEQQITNAYEMFEYGEKHMENIKVLWVPSMDVTKFQKKLNRRFASVDTLPQTREHHCFIPINGKSMTMKITSFSNKEKSVELNLM